MADMPWNDPFPEEMFTPSEEEVALIVDRAREEGTLVTPVKPRFSFRTVGGIAAAVLIVAAAALGGRGLLSLWGEPLLTGDGGAPKTEGSASGSMMMEAAGANMGGDRADGVQEPPAATRAETAPDDSPGKGVAEEDGQKSEAASGTGAAPQSAPADALSGADVADELIGHCDAVVVGNIAGGTLTVTEALYGGSGASIVLDVSIQGDAIVLLTQDGKALEAGPAIFLIKTEGLEAYSAQGVSITIEPALTQQTVRDACLRKQAQ